jgi:hypothetical protein
MDSLVGVFNNLDKNTKDLLDKTVNSLSLTYQNQDITTNSSQASDYRKKLTQGRKLTENE